jgi:hypothetical protein
MVEDRAGHTHLVWNGRRFGVAHVPDPGDTDGVGRYMAEVRAGAPAGARYGRRSPHRHTATRARAARSARRDGHRRDRPLPELRPPLERVLRDDLAATLTNMERLEPLRDRGRGEAEVRLPSRSRT